MRKIWCILVGLVFVTSLLLSETNKSIEPQEKINSFGMDMTVKETATINTELEVVSKLSEFMGATLTGFTGQIENLIVIFSIIVTVLLSFLSIAAYMKIKSLSEAIKENSDAIAKYKDEMDDRFFEHRKEIKQDIIEEVRQQIIYGLDEAILKTQTHAFKKVENTVDSLTEEIQRRRFFYQGLIYKINQAKKYEYEEVMKEAIDLNDKIEKNIRIQSKYNEINNHDIPKLFSKKIDEDVVPTAKKLAGHTNIKHIIQKLLVKILERDNLNTVQKTQIKDVLKEKYEWKEEIES